MNPHAPLSEFAKELIAKGCNSTPARAFADWPVEVQAAVEAYDAARRGLNGSYHEPPMSDANKATIAPMILAACAAFVATIQARRAA